MSGRERERERASNGFWVILNIVSIIFPLNHFSYWFLFVVFSKRRNSTNSPQVIDAYTQILDWILHKLAQYLSRCTNNISFAPWNRFCLRDKPHFSVSLSFCFVLFSWIFYRLILHAHFVFCTNLHSDNLDLDQIHWLTTFINEYTFCFWGCSTWNSFIL